MALFQKQPLPGEAVQLYTVGLNKTVLIVGLGNVGKKYDGTRHNIGFACLDSFAKAKDFDKWILKKDFKVQLTSRTLGEARVILVKPTTMMNLSGQAVNAVAQFYKIPGGQIAVVHDELDIDFGQIRTRVGGSDAGHNGIKSIIGQVGESAGQQIARIRIGIGPKSAGQRTQSVDSADFVLQKFSQAEQKQLPGLTREVSAILSEWVFGGGQPMPHETRSFVV